MATQLEIKQAQLQAVNDQKTSNEATYKAQVSQLNASMLTNQSALDDQINSLTAEIAALAPAPAPAPAPTAAAPTATPPSEAAAKVLEGNSAAPAS